MDTQKTPPPTAPKTVEQPFAPEPTGTGPGGKEGEPKGRPQEIMQPTERMPEVPKELEGVVEASPNPEVPHIPEEVKDAVAPAKDAVPHPTAPTGTVKLPDMPLSQVQVAENLHHLDTEQSSSWLSVFIDKIAKRAGLSSTQK